jgi:hypothetical protein
MIGTARNPTATIPAAKSARAPLPAIGSSALAAAAAVAMSWWPARNSVDEVARMMKYMITFEKSIPDVMSMRDCFNSSGVAPSR